MLAWWAAWHECRLWLPPSEFLFAERVLVENVSHENHLIFMRMTVQVTYIFIPINSLKDSFCHRGKSKLGIGLFIHELLREPLIWFKRVVECNSHLFWFWTTMLSNRLKKKTCAILSYNQKLNQNQSWLAHTRFPALRVSCSHLLLALIGSLDCLCLLVCLRPLWLARVITSFVIG